MIWAGKQKAVLAAVGAFAASAVLKLSTGGDVSDLAAGQEAADLGIIAADLAQSAVIGGIAFILAYFKKNVAADGTEMQFVKPNPGGSPIVVDAKGGFKEPLK